jgi:hypothetical protein
MDLRRAKVEAKALAIAKTFTIEGDCELPPLPKEVLMNGLFVCCQKLTQLWVGLFSKIPKNAWQSLQTWKQSKLYTIVLLLHLGNGIYIQL